MLKTLPPSDSSSQNKMDVTSQGHMGTEGYTTYVKESLTQNIMSPCDITDLVHGIEIGKKILLTKDLVPTFGNMFLDQSSLYSSLQDVGTKPCHKILVPTSQDPG